MHTELVEKLKDIHAKAYSQTPSVVTYAPGRVEVLGNHVDYNEGCVLSAAIDAGIAFTISPNDGQGIRLFAADFKESCVLASLTAEPAAEKSWARYIEGVLYFLSQQFDGVENWDCSFAGNLPIGFGLSSSAALEMSSALAAITMLDKNLDPLAIAKIGQRAEHDFAGCQSGLLDQLSSLLGESDRLLHIDFRSLETRTLGLPHDAVFIMLTPKISHSLSDSPYNQRRQSCVKAARILCTQLATEAACKIPGKSCVSLRDISIAEFSRLQDYLSDDDRKRAHHVLYEMKRVEDAVQDLQEGDIQAFGQRMYESHYSSRDYFENSVPELDAIVDIAREAGAAGARLSGGGWGGSLIVLTNTAAADGLIQDMQQRARQRGLEIDVSHIRPASGAMQLLNS